jgi:hypothetical protein
MLVIFQGFKVLHLDFCGVGGLLDRQAAIFSSLL